MTGKHAFMPSDEWRTRVVHWHGYQGTAAWNLFVEGDRNWPQAANDRQDRLSRMPDAVLYTPDEVADWIDTQSKEHGQRRKVWAPANAAWVEIGDEADLAHLRTENLFIAARGDSIYTDTYSESENFQLYCEAVTADECPNH